MTISLHNVDGLETGKQKSRLGFQLEKAFVPVENNSLIVVPFLLQPPAMVEVDRFPSGSLTLDIHSG